MPKWQVRGVAVGRSALSISPAAEIVV